MEIEKKNAGYDIVESEVYKVGKKCNYAVVLGTNEKTGMWVTWECRTPDYFYWGHYFENEMDARVDYHKRLMVNWDRPWEE